MTTLVEHFEKACPSSLPEPIRNINRAAFMAGAAAAVREVGAATHAVDLGKLDSAEAAEKVVVAVAARCMALTSELATWSLLSRAKVKR